MELKNSVLHAQWIEEKIGPFPARRAAGLVLSEIHPKERQVQFARVCCPDLLPAHSPGAGAAAELSSCRAAIGGFRGCVGTDLSGAGVLLHFISSVGGSHR